MKKDKILVGIITLALCLGSATAFAEETKALSRGPLADGELFTAEVMYKNVKTLYADNTITDWVWHGDNGYPLGMVFMAMVNGKDLPEIPRASSFQGGVPTKDEMVINAQNKYGIQKYENKLVLYGTTGPSAAKTQIAIKEVKLVGRLLNVVVYLTNAEPNTPLTMNLIYPETMVTIPRSALPRVGNLCVRFVDVEGRALQTQDVQLGV